MNKRKNRNANGVLLTFEQEAAKCNLGLQTVRRIAVESGSIIRIGRTCRINDAKFTDYVLATYNAEV